jgi:hypothetical protein
VSEGDGSADADLRGGDTHALPKMWTFSTADQPQHPKHVADKVDALLARTVLAHGLSIALQDPIVLERVAEIVRSARQTQRHARAEPAA